MKTIEISEAAFVQANTYYLLKWALIILVGITVIYERRSINHQIEEADRVIEVYKDLLIPAENALFGVSEIIVGGPNPSKIPESLAALRANALKLRSLTTELSELIEKRDGLSPEELEKTKSALTQLRSLLYYNDLPPEFAISPTPEEALRLVDYRLGAFHEVKAIDELSFDDAARYIWLAGVPARAMLAAADDFRLAATVGDLPEALKTYLDPEVGDQNRKLAYSIWRSWSDWAHQPELLEEEKRQFAPLQLNQPRAETNAALAVKDAAIRRRSGDTSTVTLPVLDFPLRLSDAILVLPGLMVGLLILLWVYLARGRHYSPLEKITKENQLIMVGKPPVFLLGIHHSKSIGKAIANVLVSLPILLSTTMWLYFRPPLDWTSPAILVTYVAVFLCWLCFSFLIAREISKITVLYNKDIVALGLPPSTVSHSNTKENHL